MSIDDQDEERTEEEKAAAKADVERLLASIVTDDTAWLAYLASKVDHDEQDRLLTQGAIDWSTFWTKDRSDDWLAEPFLARARSHALFAGPKVGKSLLILYAVACLAVGIRPFIPGRPRRDPVHVLYLDYEMTEDDLFDRLTDLGYGPETDLSHLHYHPIPSLPPLDTAEGGALLERLVGIYGAEVVIVDTLGRAVEGEENSNDTIRGYYRHTASRLKALGVTQLRADHSGKDVDKGQRGGSAKNDDVDIVWKLERRDDGAVLTATHRRVGWVAEKVELQMADEPVAFYRPSGTRRGYLAGTREMVELLDRLALPIDMARTKVRQAIAASGHSPGRNDVLSDAIRFRRERDAGHEMT